jgi:hypothetical protein
VRNSSCFLTTVDQLQAGVGRGVDHDALTSTSKSSMFSRSPKRCIHWLIAANCHVVRSSRNRGDGSGAVATADGVDAAELSPATLIPIPRLGLVMASAGRCSAGDPRNE